MKKIILLSSAVISFTFANAQVGIDTLLWNNFNTDPTLYMQMSYPPGTGNDIQWYNVDVDGQPDGSPSGRPGEWFWSSAFSPNDSIGNPGVMGSSSWTNSLVFTENDLVSPAIYIGDTNAVLHWKSAPFQTPRYLDGYQVLVAVGTNDVNAFTDTLFIASEYTSLDNQSLPACFCSYTFSPGPTANPMNPFIHGIDSTYTEIGASDSSRMVGLLRPFTASLAQYSGQTIYIMMHHYCIDDNLISVDDILVTGTDFTGVQQNPNAVAFSTYPNPTSDEMNIRFNLPSSSNVTFNIYDITGKLIQSENKGNLSAGEQKLLLNVSGLNAGMYQVEMVTEMGTSNSKIVVK
jgi:hypothetical protein